MAAILHIEQSAEELKISNFSDEDKTKDPCCGEGGVGLHSAAASGGSKVTHRGALSIQREESGH